MTNELDALEEVDINDELEEMKAAFAKWDKNIKLGKKDAWAELKERSLEDARGTLDAWIEGSPTINHIISTDRTIQLQTTDSLTPTDDEIVGHIVSITHYDEPTRYLGGNSIANVKVDVIYTDELAKFVNNNTKLYIVATKTDSDEYQVFSNGYVNNFTVKSDTSNNIQIATLEMVFEKLIAYEGE